MWGIEAGGLALTVAMPETPCASEWGEMGPRAHAQINSEDSPK